MVKLLPTIKRSLVLFLALSCSGLFSQSFPTSADTIRKIFATDSTWMKSTFKEYPSSRVFPWIGVDTVPPLNTFTIPVIVGQPYSFPSITQLPDAQVITAGDGVEYYRTTFEVDSFDAITDCRFRMYVDDDLAIFINDRFIASENTGAPYNFNGVPHDLMIYDFGPYDNGYNAGDQFDYVTLDPPEKFIHPGTNSIILAVRNKPQDLGGFSFRMDYSYVVNPEWFGTNEEMLEEPVNIFPNPVNDVVIFENLPDNTLSLKILGLNGQLLINHKVIKGEEKLVVNLRSLRQGVYLVQIETANHTFTKKLVKN